MLVESLTREQAVEVARSWIGTKYVLGGRVKGAGCDCATLIAEYLIECGFSERDDLGVYSHDWFHHSQSERYMQRIIRHAPKTIEGICRGTIHCGEGSIILFKVANSKLYNHGGVITKWPTIVHSVYPSVKEVDCTSYHMTGFTNFSIFDPWSKP